MTEVQDALRFAWVAKEGEQGDERLYVNDKYFGIVCPHPTDGFVNIVWDGGDHINCSRTMARAKAFLEAVAAQEARIEALRLSEPLPDPW
jgi:hypothetical protein